MTKKTTRAIHGTPHEVGAEVFDRFCLPALKAAGGRPPEEIMMLYHGFIGAALGSMTADFGHEMAVTIARHTVEQFSRMAAEFGDGGRH